MSLYKSLDLRQPSPIIGSKHTVMTGKRGYHNNNVMHNGEVCFDLYLMLEHMSVNCSCMAGRPLCTHLSSGITSGSMPLQRWTLMMPTVQWWPTLLCVWGADRHQQGGAEGVHRHHSFPVHHHGADTLPSMAAPSAWLLL